MINTLFVSDFYTIFPAPNAEELFEFIEQKGNIENVDNDYFNWGSNCKVDRVPLKWKDIFDLYNPSIDFLSKLLDKKFNYTLFNPWINLYFKGYYQEVHCHKGYDISSIFFANDGDNFSKLFFLDRNATNFSNNYEDLISYTSTFNVSYKKGDVIFFPSHLLHGVTSHESDRVRKTLSTNISIDKVL